MGTELTAEFHLSGDVTLRTFRHDDADAVFAAVIRNLEHLKPFMEWAVPDYSIESAKEFIERGIASRNERKNLGFGIFKSGVFVGSIGYVKLNWTARKTEIGYWIDKAEEGKGIISAACKVLIDYAFDELGMNRVEIRCSAENKRSAAIPERFGFKKEGVLRQAEFRNGSLHDFVVYGLLADEWPKNRLRVESAAKGKYSFWPRSNTEAACDETYIFLFRDPIGRGFSGHSGSVSRCTSHL